jgi:hypothetical protein
MKHTLKEILAIWATHVGHTFEAAVQAIYDAGHARAREEFEAGLASPEPPPAPAEGETSDEKQTSAGQAGTGQSGQESQEPAAEATAHSAA